MSIKDEWVGRWLGRVVVCIASGPSLTHGDCQKVRESGHLVIVTNNTFQMCPWADVLMAFDSKWWREYAGEVCKDFRGERLSCAPATVSMGIPSLHAEPWFQHYGNSGTAAISLAIVGGAKRVVMLGYDCQRTGGKTHWHGDHIKPLGNASSMNNWPKQFQGLARFADKSGVAVVNATRETALTCFPRQSLVQALG